MSAPVQARHLAQVIYLADQSEADEEWRLIPGFPDYKVSSLGRLMTNRRRAPGDWRLLAPNLNRVRGYPHTNLRGPDGRVAHFEVHKLVALAFLGPRPEKGMHICHNDGDRTNNAVTNLRYDTPSSNQFDAVRHGTHQMTRKTHCPQGHEFNDENTYRHGGKRYCRPCLAARRRRMRKAVSL